MSRLHSLFAAVSVSLVAFLATAEGTLSWTTGNYEPKTWTRASDNLLSTATVAKDSENGLEFYTEGGKTMSQNLADFANGEVPGESCEYTKIIGVTKGNVYWTLPNKANLDSLSIYTRWGDGGRDGIAISWVQVRRDGASDWEQLDGSSLSYGCGDNNTSGHLYATLARSDGTPIATDVVGIKIRFSSSQDNGGSGYVEVEARGSATATPQVSLGATSVAPWVATLSGSVSSLAGAPTGDLYFACGTDAAALSPVLTKSGLAEGDDFTISLTNLQSSTTYHYVYRLDSSLGVSSSTKNGSFTTTYAQLVEMEAVHGYIDRSSSEVRYSISNLGEQGTSVDLYFAYGTSDSLTPTLYASGLTVSSGTIPLTGLSPNTTYYYAIYAMNQLGHFCATLTGRFTTNAETDVPKWVGRVSSSWSEPDNWDPATTFSAGDSIDKVVLTAFEGAYEPSDVDVAGLTIKEIRVGNDGKTVFAVDGLPLTLRNFTAESADSATTLRLENDVSLPSKSCNVSDRVNIWFAGPVHNADESGTVELVTQGNNSTARLMNPSNDVTLTAVAHVGTIYFNSNGALGAHHDDISTPNVYQNYGAVGVTCPEGLDYTSIVLDPYRYPRGAFRFAGDIDLTLQGLMPGLEFGYWSHTVANQVRLAGTSLPGDGDFSSTIKIQPGIIGILDSASLAADRTRVIDCASSSFDLNGYSFAGRLTNYGWGLDGAPIYNNNDRTRTSLLTGEVAPYPHIGTQDFFFGGAGDIRVEVPVIFRTVEGRPVNALRKTGQGMLTFAGTQGSWGGETMMYGGVTLDYSVNNTPKLPEGQTGLYVAYGKVVIRGNAAATTSELTSLRLDGGLVEFVTEPGAGGLAVALDSINYNNRKRAIDFQIGAGTTFTIADAVNLDNFPGIWPNATWNHGETWAYANSDHTIGPVADSLLDKTLATSSTVWDIGSGETAVSSSTPRGIRVAATEGDATITISGTVDVRKRNPGGVSGILISSKSTGDVTFTGGALKVENYNGETSIHNWNTNGVVRIASQIPETNDNNCEIYGPGTTILENDTNAYYYGPHCFGGGTVKFTSIADMGVKCALGKCNGNSSVECGHGTTYEYIGTLAEGHSSDRRFTLYGDVTYKANGAGTLLLTNGTVFNTGYRYSCSRLILAGDAAKAGGEIRGAIDIGAMGSVVKRGTGTWTIASTTSKYGYPTDIEAGTLILDGTLPSDVIVRSGATLVLRPGAVIKRSLKLEAGANLVYDNAVAGATPLVWGTAELKGALRFAQKPPAGEICPVIEARNGCTVDGLVAPGMKLYITPNGVAVRRNVGLSVFVR